LRTTLGAGGLKLPTGDSPIVPIIVGEEAAALRAAEELAGLGFLVQAIRPPTVGVGASRLRVTLCCEHRDGDVDALADALIQSALKRAGAAD
jgi:8-amino-7-oxononanoate synthase